MLSDCSLEHLEHDVMQPNADRQRLSREPECCPDDNCLDILFRERRRAACEHNGTVPPRDDLMSFGPDKQEELDTSVQWEDCPSELHDKIMQVVKDFWDTFNSDGTKQSVLGFQAAVDTGNAKPAHCLLPECRPHESEVAMKLVQGLKDNGSRQ